MKNPKVWVRDFLLKDNTGGFVNRELIKLWKNYQSIQPNIQSIEVEDHECIDSLLTHLNPEKVENIYFERRKYLRINFNVDQFNKIAGNTQWKKITSIRGVGIPRGTRLEQLQHFKEFHSTLFDINDVNLVTIRDIILKSPHLEKWSLQEHCDEDEKGTAWMMRKVHRIMIQDPDYNSQTFRFSIPDSHDYFQFGFDKDRRSSTLTITRIRAK